MEELITLEFAIAIAYEQSKNTLTLSDAEVLTLKNNLMIWSERVYDAKKDLRFEEDRMGITKYN